jgi:hypothetical protein
MAVDSAAPRRMGRPGPAAESVRVVFSFGRLLLVLDSSAVMIRVVSSFGARSGLLF